MCYYNGQLVGRAELIRLKQLEKLVQRYDFLNAPLRIGFDYGDIAVLKPVAVKKDFDIVKMEWGFLPSYLQNREQVHKFRNGYKDEKGKYHPPILTLNAVSEELLLPRKIYRDAALHRRCLVLSSGFYEWRHIHPIGKKGLPLKSTEKYPYFVYLPGHEYFFIAAIWQPWKDRQTGELVDTVTLITTEANGLMAQVHNSRKRMPTILNEDLAYEWMFGDLDEERITEIAMTQYPSGQMKAYPIARDFREAHDPMTAFEYAELPALQEN